MTRPRLGLFDEHTAYGGAWRYVEAILARLDPREFDLTLFCRRTGPYEQRPGVRLVYIPERAAAPAGPTDSPSGEPARGDTRRASARTRLRSAWRAAAPAAVLHSLGFARSSRALARLFRQHPVDLLHTNQTGYDPAAAGARLAGVANVLGTLHIDTTPCTAAGWLPEFVTNHCLHRAIAVSESTRRDWVRRSRLDPDRVVTIPNGVDPAKFSRRSPATEARASLGVPTDGRLIGAVGRLTPQKGFEFLLEAVRMLTASGTDVALALAGDGVLRHALEEKARDLGISGRVSFLGHRRDVQTVYDASDVFVLPSLYEAMPYALLEAMAAGLPIVGTRVSGVPEVIVDGTTGFLVPPKDPTALAQSIKKLLQSDDLRHAMGNAGRLRIEADFHEEARVEQTIGMYRSMLGIGAQVPRMAPVARKIPCAAGGVC